MRKILATNFVRFEVKFDLESQIFDFTWMNSGLVIHAYQERDWVNEELVPHLEATNATDEFEPNQRSVSNSKYPVDESRADAKTPS